MSTTPYNPDEANGPPAGVPRKEGLTNAGSKAGNFPRSQPLSRSRLRGGSSGCGHCEVSDDDLIVGAQRGDQQAFAELCRRHSPLVKNKILRIVTEPGGRRRRTSRHSVASLYAHVLLSPVLQILNVAHNHRSEFGTNDYAETKSSQRNLCKYEQSGYGISGNTGAVRPITRAREDLSETTSHSSCEATS